MGILLLILLQFCQSSGGIISDPCRSQSLGTFHSTVCCTILSVERCSLGNTSLHSDKMTPPLQEYCSVLYCTIPYYTIQNISHDRSNTKLDRFMWYTTF